MRVLVIGSAGMLGQDLIAAAEAAGHDTVGLAHQDVNINDAAATQTAIGDSAPDVVVNCAAWTDVDGAEASPAKAHDTNATGAGNAAAAAARAGAWMVQISTDYVFDGAKRVPYVESDPPSPVSVYGSSKLAGEHEVAAHCPTSHTIVRSSWLFGTQGHCFPATIMRLAVERGELTVVDDQVGCPTFTGHLAHGIVDLLEASTVPVGIVHMAAAGSCSWYDFAGEVIASAGLTCEVRAGVTADLARPARRPAYSVLATERDDVVPRLPDWRAGLVQYMSARMHAA
jgi:dTDP-4-dehydrorhamnose reductase